MTPPHIHTLEGCLVLKNRIRGVGWHRDPHRHFGPGGLAQAEKACAAANEDLARFIRPPERMPVEGLSRHSVERPGGRTFELVELDSPLPSGDAANDRLKFRLYRPERPAPHRQVVVFHHALYQNWWPLWEWFLSDLIDRMPVAMMAGPYHFGRVPAGEYPGESVCNPNPFKLFEALRQWTWDQRAVHAALDEQFDLAPSAVIGFSFGAFQTLLATSVGILDLPIVSIASTNRYAYGVFNGVLSRGIKEGLLRVGIDEARLEAMTASLQLERWVTNLDGHPILYIDGVHDRVDPPPSLERLKAALRPARAVHLPAGHGTLVLHRQRIAEEMVRFFETVGVA
jgi:pimeloyl-ACP methyl ester carboxylesterase